MGSKEMKAVGLGQFNILYGVLVLYQALCVHVCVRAYVCVCRRERHTHFIRAASMEHIWEQ